MENETYTFQKGGVQLSVALSLVPVQREEAQVKFSYIDGNSTSGYALDTITADYVLDQRYYGRAIAIGIGYFWNANFRTALTMRPHLNSFLSNKAKNGKVYGIQFGMALGPDRKTLLVQSLDGATDLGKRLGFQVGDKFVSMNG